MQANITTLVSRATGAAGAVGDGSASSSSISADGEHVAFHSNADNLDPDSGDDAGDDVFVRELIDPIPAQPPVEIKCAGKVATKVGTSAKNTISGTPGPDVIAGLGGNDVIKGLGGKDSSAAARAATV